MRIYIASSWKNEHGVEMLTRHLENRGHTVISFVRAATDKENLNEETGFNEWVFSEDGTKKFQYDIDGATKSNLVIYYGPSGTDAWAEVGAAYGSGVKIYGLWSKGEPAGLMRRMVIWFNNIGSLLDAVHILDTTSA